MIEHQQPKEHPIDYLECARIDIRGNSFIYGDSMVVDMVEVDAVINKLKDERARSRPHPAPGTLQKVYEGAFDEGLEIGKAQCETHHKEMRDEAARQAREEYDTKIGEIMDEISRQQLEYGMVSNPVIGNIMEMLGSLMSTTPHTEQEQPR